MCAPAPFRSPYSITDHKLFVKLRYTVMSDKVKITKIKDAEIKKKKIQTGTGFGTKERMTPAISVILC
jgi:hypothetical protein